MAGSEVAQKQAFKNGLRLYNWGQYDRALDELSRAIRLENRFAPENANPVLLSYYGVALSRVKKEFKTSEKWCRLALNRGQHFPEVFLNLSTVLELSGKKEQAIETLRNGYRRHSDNVVMLESLQRISPRTRVPFPFLDRNNFINKLSGKVLSRASRFAGRNHRHQ